MVKIFFVYEMVDVMARWSVGVRENSGLGWAFKAVDSSSKSLCIDSYHTRLKSWEIKKWRLLKNLTRKSLAEL